jgi:2-polyprenyl-3-methyl-5-hydroxy-6-metoxy-1,4-benzoquinol methylase
MRKLHQSEIITSNGKAVKFRAGENKCPVCNSDKGGSVIYKFDEYSIIKCGRCSTMHLDPIPDEESLNLIYNTKYYKDDEEEHGYKDYRKDENLIRKTYHKRFEFIKSHIPDKCKDLDILEIGCALGFGLNEAEKIFKSKIYGADISQEAVETCRRNGFEAYLCKGDGTFESQNNKKYRLIYAFDVLEHLTKTEKFVSWVYSLLSDNGIFALTTPDMNSLLNMVLGSRTPAIKIPQHIIYFTKDTLQNAFKDRFKIINSKIDFQYVSLRALFIRIRHILGLSYKPMSLIPDIGIAVPNGMKIYLFEKNSSAVSGK